MTWTLAAAGDYDGCNPADHTAALLARQAGVGDRVWQKRTAWLREHSRLQNGPGGQGDGRVLSAGNAATTGCDSQTSTTP